MSTELSVRTVQLSLRLPGEQASKDARWATHVLGQMFELLDELTRIELPEGRRPSWAFARLELGSVAATIEAPAVADEEEAEKLRRGMRRFTQGLAFAEANEQIPPEWGDPAVRRARKVTRLLGDTGIELQLLNDQDDDEYLITKRCSENLRKALSSYLETVGSLTGRLEGIDLHEKRKARLWLEAPRRPVEVQFSEEDYDLVVGALRSRVQVSGLIRHNHRRQAQSMKLRRLRILAPKKTPIDEYTGLAPGLTGDLNSAEYVMELRDAS